jgi:hypothetical protein
MRRLSGAAGAAALVSALLITGLWSIEARGCSVAGEKIEFGDGSDFPGDILVRPRGGDPFRLSTVSAERVLVRVPSERRARTSIEVHGVVSFTGTTGPLPYQISRPLEASQGMVRLYPGATLSRAARDHEEVVASVELQRAVETLESVRVPCDALALNVRSEPPGQRLISGDGTYWRTKGTPRRFALHARPDERAPRIVLAVRNSPESPEYLSFERLAVRAGWAQVAREGFRVVATGWVPIATLQQVATAPSRSGCCYGDSSGTGSWRRGRDPKPFSYEGPAHVAVGTTIFAGKGKGAWAKVEKDAVFKVRYDEGDAWAEILTVPGLAGPEMRAFVQIAAITRGT